MSSAPSRSKSRTEQQVLDLANEGLRLTEIARKAGVSLPFVRKVLGPSRKGTRGRPSEAGPLSAAHRAVGLRILGHFVKSPIEPDLDDRASFFGWSTRKQGRIERGTWDLTLDDLTVLSDRTGIPIYRLLGERP